MTDKHIINGVDITECSHHEGKLCSMSREAYCYCSDKPNCIYKRFKRKEQECEQERTLKEMYFTYYKAKHSDVKGEFFKLKEENWELKRELIQYEKDFKDLNYCAIKLKQTLAEIKEVVLKILNYLVLPSPGDIRCEMHKILQKISEVEDEKV